MANGDDDHISLEYLPLIAPVMFVEILLLNYYMYFDWKRRLMSSGDSNVPLFSRPESLHWLLSSFTHVLVVYKRKVHLINISIPGLLSVLGIN